MQKLTVSKEAEFRQKIRTTSEMIDGVCIALKYIRANVALKRKGTISCCSLELLPILQVALYEILSHLHKYVVQKPAIHLSEIKHSLSLFTAVNKINKYLYQLCIFFK